LLRITAFLRGGFEYLAMAVGLTALLQICLLGLPAALLLMCLPKDWRIPLGRRLIAFGFTTYLWFLRIFCFVRLDCSALDTIRQQPSLIVIANHPSLLDAVILLSKLPRAACVMKAILRSNPLFASMARLSGYISNEDPMKLIKQSCDELASGRQLLIFPEGTRTVTPPINSFGQMTALIASRSNSVIQTVFIDYSTLYLGKSGSLFQKPTLPLVIKVRLGDQFESSGSSSMMTERLESYYRESFNNSPSK
jgi:1-acyl-sn-glycerol-3-phosphate acyltransferase